VVQCGSVSEQTGVVWATNAWCRGWEAASIPRKHICSELRARGIFLGGFSSGACQQQPCVHVLAADGLGLGAHGTSGAYHLARGREESEGEGEEGSSEEPMGEAEDGDGNGHVRPGVVQ
jgi:hypothetical protein